MKVKVKALTSSNGITKNKIYEADNKLVEHRFVEFYDDYGVLRRRPTEEFGQVKEPTLKEKYFVSGNVAETRGGNKYLIVNNGAMRLDGEGFIRKSETKDDLTGMNFLQFDFMKVYKMAQPTAFNYIEKYGGLELIWQREEEVKEVTIAELEKQYGCKVKVVK